MSEPETACATPRESSEATTAPPAVPVPPEPSPTAGGNIANLSLLELLIILSCYAFFFYKFIPSFRDHPTWPAALVLVAESETILVLLARRAAHSFSAAPSAWLLALATTIVPPLLIYPAKQPCDPWWVGATLYTVGFCVASSARSSWAEALVSSPPIAA